jgi:hypothetical protein
MKKLLYLGFCLVLAMGVGCAITDYPVMVDAYTGEIVNTNSNAMILSSQVATIWADGADNLFTMINQKADGSGTLRTYNYYTTDGTYFQDYNYCHPDWNGCAIVTAENGGPMFDYTYNINCNGIRSLSVLVGMGMRYQECGRLDMGTKNDLYDQMIQTPNGAETYLTRNNLTVLTNGVAAKVYGATHVSVEQNHGLNYVTIEVSPLTKLSFDQWAAQNEGPQTVSIHFGGVFVGDYNVQAM